MENSCENNKMLFKSFVWEKIDKKADSILLAIDKIEEFAIITKVIEEPIFNCLTQKNVSTLRKRVVDNKFFVVKNKKIMSCVQQAMILLNEYILDNAVETVKKQKYNSDEIIRNRNSELYDKVYLALKELSLIRTWGVSVLAIYERSGGSLSEIKSVLDQVTWAKAEGKKYLFVEKNKDNVISSVEVAEETVTNSIINVNLDTDESEPLISEREIQVTSDTELKANNPSLYHKLYSVSKVFDDPQGLTIDRIMAMVGSMFTKDEVIDFLDRVSWATKLLDGTYTFAENVEWVDSQFEENLKSENDKPSDYDKEALICVLMRRYQSGMQFDSIDLEIFRDTYEDMYDEKLLFTDEELEIRLKQCGILHKDRLFPAEGIIDNRTKERLFAYIENKFAAGSKVLYYKAIFSDLADAFAYCFSLADEQMLKAYIEHTAEKGKYYFHSNFMSVEKDVTIDHLAEIEDFMLAAGKPLFYDEVYDGLSHVSRDIIYHKIRTSSKFVMNGKEQYYHIDIFEFSETDGDRIAKIFNKEIEETGYVIWSMAFLKIQEQMPVFIENNLYLSPLGIRNALARFMADKFDFDGEVISTYGFRLDMADVYRLFAKHHTPFSDNDIYEFSKEVGTPIYFWSLAEESVRVSRSLFVSKEQIEFDIEATDKALETYLSSGYILVKDVDSFLVFPNVGYEWNEFLLESYLLHYSKKFCLVNNGVSLNNVAGAVAKKDGEFTQFVDICAQALADSSIELKKTAALNYLADINLITRRSYKELDIAMTKARQIRNQKGI